MRFGVLRDIGRMQWCDGVVEVVAGLEDERRGLA